VYYFSGDVRLSQKLCNHHQNLRIAPSRIIKPWRVYERHPAAPKLKWLRNLYDTGG
jgi:hypothetical protein